MMFTKWVQFVFAIYFFINIFFCIHNTYVRKKKCKKIYILAFNTRKYSRTKKYIKYIFSYIILYKYSTSKIKKKEFCIVINMINDFIATRSKSFIHALFHSFTNSLFSPFWLKEKERERKRKRDFHLKRLKLNCMYFGTREFAFRAKKRICSMLLCIAMVLNFHRKPKRLRRISADIPYFEIFYTCVNTVDCYYASRSPRALLRYHPSLSPR